MSYCNCQYLWVFLVCRSAFLGFYGKEMGSFIQGLGLKAGLLHFVTNSSSNDLPPEDLLYCYKTSYKYSDWNLRVGCRALRNFFWHSFPTYLFRWLIPLAQICQQFKKNLIFGLWERITVNFKGFWLLLILVTKAIEYLNLGEGLQPLISFLAHAILVFPF